MSRAGWWLLLAAAPLLAHAAPAQWSPASYNRSLELGECWDLPEGARGHLATVVSRCGVPGARVSTLATLRTTQMSTPVLVPTPPCVIRCVRALDQLAETPLTNVTLHGGGPGHTFVSLDFRAPVGYGYFFTLDAFLNCTVAAATLTRETAPGCGPCQDF